MSGETTPRAGHDARRASGTGPVLFLDQRFDARTLYQLRAALSAHVAELGVPVQQANDILIAVHELASNAVRHGEGHGRLRGWTDGRTVICTVIDGDLPVDLTYPAEVFDEPAAPANPPWPVLEGHGLWLVNQVADHLFVNCDDGTVMATVSFTTRR